MMVCSFLNSALDKGEWSTLRLGRYYGYHEEKKQTLIDASK
jgi:hypothetical protein